MKKITFNSALFLLVVFGLTSCNKEIDFTTVIENQEICVPAYAIQPSNGHLNTYDYSIKNAIQKVFGDNGISFAESKVKEVKVVSFTISFKSGSKNNLSDLQGVQVYAKKAGTSGLGKQVAVVTIPENATTVNFDVTGESLKDLISEDLITFSVTSYLRYSTGTQGVCATLSNGVIKIETTK